MVRATLAFDFGEKHVGVAISQDGQAPQALTTIAYRDEFELKKALSELARQYEPQVVVVGTSAHAGPTFDWLLGYLGNLSFVGKVELIDESFTTTQAQKELAEESLPAPRRGQADHARAAALILRDFLAKV